DENKYADNSHANERVWSDLVQEFLALRKSTEALLKSFFDKDLEQSGMASNSHISVLAICFIIIGHAEHHLNILRERYLVG
ncbi:MAG: DNA damage-inducible protein DinB, partial [Ginsengibacter sp.]